MPRKPKKKSLPRFVERDRRKGSLWFRVGRGPRIPLPDDPATTEFRAAYSAALVEIIGPPALAILVATIDAERLGRAVTVTVAAHESATEFSNTAGCALKRKWTRPRSSPQKMALVGSYGAAPTQKPRRREPHNEQRPSAVNLTGVGIGQKSHQKRIST